MLVPQLQTLPNSVTNPRQVVAVGFILAENNLGLKLHGIVVLIICCAEIPGYELIYSGSFSSPTCWNAIP